MSEQLELVLRLAATAVLIALNALYVFHEFAYVALKPGQIREIDRDQSAIGRLVSKAAHRLDHYIAVDQLGITATSIAVGWVGLPVVVQLFESAFGGVGVASPVMLAISGILAFSLVTGTQMVVGELMPKSYALRNPERTARFTARPVELTAKIFHPLVLVLNGVGLGAVRLLGFRGTGESHHPVMPAEELVALAYTSAKAGLIPADPETLRRLVNFSDLKSSDLMVPRLDVVAISSEATLEEVLNTARAHQHDRYPVYEGSPDWVTGVVSIKDLLAATIVAGSNERVHWQRQIRSIPVLPDTASVETLLATLNRSNQQMALLVDELGIMSGVITTTDITEQLIAGPDEIVTEPDGSYVIAGHASTALVESELALSLNDDERSVDTIAGLVLDELSRIPKLGNTVEVNGVRLTVTAMVGHRVTQVRLERPSTGEPTDASSDASPLEEDHLG